ncbi:MAG: twin-arginine translocase TatA/TatE family subunit [Thermoleophilia bacterium]|jgi:sec-independent protein translocase protein TatA
MPGWLGPWEILIVVVIILLVFGGKLLPKLGSSLGRSITGLKKGLQEGEEGFKAAIKEDPKVGAEVDIDTTGEIITRATAQAGDPAPAGDEGPEKKS